jgi:hypothetical protein
MLTSLRSGASLAGVSPRLPVAVIGLAAAALAGPAVAAPSRPSDRACLLAWNAALNQANRVRLIAARPTGLSLVPGVTFTHTWTKGSAPKQTRAQACLLTLSKPGHIQVVTGIWRAGRVSRWSFGHTLETTRPFVANVRLLSDGRVTKIYRH